jgi:predicted naringenin-chalcone synthase
MTTSYINRIATVVPPFEVHEAFTDFIHSQLRDDARNAALFRRMAEKGGIEKRYSCLQPSADVTGPVADTRGFYKRGDFPNTADRMRMFEEMAPALAESAVEQLELGDERRRISHLLITCCTGFSAPGLDLQLIERCRLPSHVERTMIGFMGCYAAINALKLARHIVRSDRTARVLVLNLELCTLHFQQTMDLGRILSFFLFADGCAASLVSAEPQGLALDRFHAVLAPDSQEMITWNIRDSGFDMVLSGQVPAVIHQALSGGLSEILAGGSVDSIDLWAIHPGGRTVLDAVERALQLAPEALAASREVLRQYGNMSSATVMFVLAALMRNARKGASGCAMAFGPGLVAETMLFRAA